MTLDTSVVAITECDPHDVFHYCRQLLGATDAHVYTDRDMAEYYRSRGFKWEADYWQIGNEAGQGLPALLDLQYKPNAPFRTPEESAAHGEDCEEDCDGTSGYTHAPACWLELSFDTAYSYKDELGRGCGDLHAQLLARLGQWFDERGIEWGWENEFTGEWHLGEGKYEALKELVSGGAEATAWFKGTVQPAIMAETGGKVQWGPADQAMEGVSE